MEWKNISARSRMAVDNEGKPLYHIRLESSRWTAHYIEGEAHFCLGSFGGKERQEKAEEACFKDYQRRQQNTEE